MCLSKFKEFQFITEENAITGYRSWKNETEENNLKLKSEFQDYEWSKVEGPHEIKENDSGIYSYNNYNNYNYDYNDYYYNDYYNYNNYNNYYYNLAGIIKQWGKVAIHDTGYRSEYAKIDTLFNVRLSNVEGKLTLIKQFNERIDKIAKLYECKVISWQDFIEIK